jgi:uncharacterized glyoxalase superfamily protein PhnB
MVQSIPAGFHSLTPHLIVREADDAIDFYVQAFGAEEIRRMLGEAGKVMHAELQIGDSIMMLADEFPDHGTRSPESVGGTSVTLHLYVDDTDAVYERAVAAGATAIMPPADTFWGDRYAKIDDPFGHSWAIATRQEELSSEEISRRAANAMMPHDD